MKELDEKQMKKAKTGNNAEEDSDTEKGKTPTKKGKTPAKPRIKPSFYYISSSDDEADILKDRFWKDLEDGKVDIFRTADLYSTVKAIGRSARPKSLAESDLRRSGLRSATSGKKDEKEEGVRGKKGKGTPAKGSRKTRSSVLNEKRSSQTPESSCRVNLGVKVDVENSSSRISISSSDDETLETDSKKTRISKQKKKIKKNEEKKREDDDDDDDDDEEDDDDEDDDDDDDDDKEDESETEDSEIEEDTKIKKRKGKSNVVSQPKKRKIIAEDNKAAKSKKYKGKGKEKGKEQEVSEEDEENKVKKQGKKRINEDVDEDDEDEDEKEEEVKEIKQRKNNKTVKKKTEKEMTEDEDGDADDGEEVDEKVTEKVEKTVKKKKKKEVTPAKVYVDPEVVSRHLEEAIDRVIAESRAMWMEKYGSEDTEEDGDEEEEVGSKEVNNGESEISRNTEIQKTQKRRHSGDENDDGADQKSDSKPDAKPKKFQKSGIDYLSDEDAELGSEPAKMQESKRRTSEESEDSEDTDEDVDDEEQDIENSAANDEIEKPVLPADLEADALYKSLHGDYAEDDLKEEEEEEEETENREPDDAAEDTAAEDASVDHLVFNLETVESIEPVETTNAYADSNIKDLTDEDLYKAVKYNDFDLVEVMMKEAQQFDLEQVDESGLTLTMIATKNYSLEIVEMLVLNGANVNARTKDSDTALSMACDKGFHCAVSLLLCLGANINCQLQSGDTPLILAVKKNHYHVVRVLLEHGVNIGASGVGDRHALSFARQLNYQPITEILNSHKIHLTSELFQQISMALEGSAKISASVFPIQCFRLCDGSRFVVDFRHELQPTQTNRGMLLFLGHGCGSSSNVQARLYGSCAVTKAVLNDVTLQPLNEQNFIMTFCPLRDGHNQLEISTVPLNRSTYKIHLIVAAFVVTLL